MATIPNPGSQEAIDKGCQCAILDNCHGKGFPYPDKQGNMKTCFWINQDCPMHGRNAPPQIRDFAKEE